MTDYHREPPTGPGFWIKELPFLIILGLTLGGAAYTSVAHRQFAYWDFLAVVIAVVCIASGWPHAYDAGARWRLIWTQALHWGAFLVAMNLVLLPSVQAIANSDYTSLTILLLLALGTFVAGVHTGSWRMGANGVIMALSVPAIAWLDQSALLVTLIAVAVIGLAAAFFWWRRTAVGS
ncbi:MAG: hypothetical protein ACLPSF_09430 [Methylocella sp.]